MIEDLLIEFDEMGFAPTTLCENSEKYAVEWKKRLVAEIDKLQKACKSEWVHLPCKVGSTVYQVDSERIYEITVRNIIYDTYGIAFDERAIGKSVFLTREEAVKALENMRKEDEGK